MKNFTISISGGFIINNIVATVIAIFILNPLLNTAFEGTVRTTEQGLNMVSLLSGYFLLTLIMTLTYSAIRWNYHWAINGLIFGLATGGIVFVSGHLIVAGWSIIPQTPMLISGILDSLATIATGIFIAFIYRNANTRTIRHQSSSRR